MKKLSTLIIKKSLIFRSKALLTIAILFSLGFASVKAQSPYCTPYYNYQYGNCTQYNYGMSINAFQLLSGTKVLYNRAHTTTYGGCNAASGDYFLMSTSSMFTLKGGTTYSFGFTTGPNYPVNMFVWIDLNGDNDFADANENLALKCSGSSGSVPSGSSTLTYFSVTVPTGGTATTTRMRIRSSYYGKGCPSTSDNGCNDMWYGECEDYTITLASFADDATVTAIVPPLCNYKIAATIANVGTNAISSGVDVGWSVNGAFQTANKITSTIAAYGGTSTLTLAPDFTFIDGQAYTVKVFTYNPNGTSDKDKTDDTATIKFNFVGPAGTPTTFDNVKCGPGRAILKCTTPFSTDSIYWYNAATAGNIVAKGKNTLSPSLFLGVNKFWAQAFKMSSTKNINGGLNFYTWFSGGSTKGGMFNLTPSANMALDSFTVRLQSLVINPTFTVYYKLNTYKGSETNAANWTLVQKDIVAKSRTISGANYATIAFPEVPLTAGQVYGFYVTTTVANPSNPLINSYSTAGVTTTNAEISLYNGTFFPTTDFGTNYYYYNMGVQAHYRLQFCPSTRVPVTITVNPSPNGAGFTKGTPFQTTMANTTGNPGSPDIVAKGDKLNFNLTPPTGYTNAGFGTTWETITPILKTKKGTVISSTLWSYTAPTASTSGSLTFSPDASVVDSAIIISMMIKDKGPYFCDSTIFRSILVAPRPVVEFSFPQPVCDGDAVLFTDLSTISSGAMYYRWDFNTGNPADTSTINTTVFKFPTFGSYDVTLRATSIPYGYVETKTYTVVVTEIPKISFKVLNACEKVPVTFTNTTTIGAGSFTSSWNFGDKTALGTTTNTTHIYANAGAYKVTLRATSNGCTSELSKNANQFAVPTAKFTFPSLICDQSDVQFTNGSTIKLGNMGYTWNFGDGGISNFANPVHQYATTGSNTRTVKMKAVSEFGCVDSSIKVITLLEAPNADFTWGAACNLTATSFTFNGTKPAGALTTFNWNFSGEGSALQENPSKLFSVTGRKNVTLSMVSNNGCSDVVTKEVNVKLQSKAEFLIGDVCEDDDAVFTNKSTVSQGNLVYNWKFGDLGTSNAQSPRHRYNIGGVSQTYNVTLVAVVPGGCSDSISKQVSVNAKPQSDFTFTTSGRQVSFVSKQAGNTIYQWRFGDGGNATTANKVYDYLDFGSGKYQACLAVVNVAGCFSETCKLVQISSGVDKITKLSGVKVYPNPNKGNFTVTVEDPKSDITIGVYNLLGEVVKTIETSSLKSTYSIDLNVANGVYLVKVTNGGLTSTQKITINK